MKEQAPASPALVLRFDFEAITRLAEAENGINLLDGLDAGVMKNPAVYVMLVWAGLLHTDDALTVVDARSKIRGRLPRDVIKLVTEALNRDIGEKQADASAGEADGV